MISLLFRNLPQFWGPQIVAVTRTVGLLRGPGNCSAASGWLLKKNGSAVATAIKVETCEAHWRSASINKLSRWTTTPRNPEKKKNGKSYATSVKEKKSEHGKIDGLIFPRKEPKKSVGNEILMLVSSHQPKMAHGKDPSKLSIYAIVPHCLSWVLHLKSRNMIAIMTQTASIKLGLKTCSTKKPSTSNSTEPFPRLHHMDRWWRWPSSQMWPDICRQVNRLKTWLVVDHGLESVTESRSKVLLGGWNFTTSPTKKNLPRQIHGFSCWGRGGEGKWYETQTGIRTKRIRKGVQSEQIYIRSNLRSPHWRSWNTVLPL